MNPDLINGLFEFLGGLTIWVNIRRAYLDKRFHGVSILPTLFFNSWGLWNLYYYPHLDQWWSFLGGLSIFSANTIWVCQMIYYNRRNR